MSKIIDEVLKKRAEKIQAEEDTRSAEKQKPMKIVQEIINKIENDVNESHVAHTELLEEINKTGCSDNIWLVKKTLIFHPFLGFMFYAHRRNFIDQHVEVHGTGINDIFGDHNYYDQFYSLHRNTLVTKGPFQGYCITTCPWWQFWNRDTLLRLVKPWF
jgi:hypothetical protein